MDGPSHYAKAEDLAGEAEMILNQGDPDGLAAPLTALAQLSR
jgi:hypothetical protein